MALQQLPLPPEPPGDPLRRLIVHSRGCCIAVSSLGGTVCLFAQNPRAATATASGSSGATCRPFSRAAVFAVHKHLWSLAFAEDSGGPDGASTSAQQPPAAPAQASAEVAAAGECADSLTVCLSALHQHPHSRTFVVVDYVARCQLAPSGEGDGTDLHATLEAAAVQRLARDLLASTEVDDLKGGGSRGATLGAPRALVQLPAAAGQPWPPQLAGARLVLRERGLELIAPAQDAGRGHGEQAAEAWQQQQQGAQQALESWWQRHDNLDPASSQQPRPSGQRDGTPGPAGASPEAAERPGSPAGSAGASSTADSAGAEAAGTNSSVPMAVSQGSGSSMAEDEHGDEDTPAAAGEVDRLAAAGSETGTADMDAAAAGVTPSASEAGDADLPASTDAAAAEAAARRACFITCCVWEQAQQAQQSTAVLVCALEDGTLCRLPLPTRLPPADSWAAASARCASLPLLPHAPHQQARLGSPARCLAAAPGGLLLYCTDAAGAQLLQLAGEPSVYEPLLPPHLLAAQQPLGWAEAGAAGACTLPAAGALVGCTLADLEGSPTAGGGGSGQQQLYAVCRGTGAGGGSLCVLYQDPKPDAVFELPGAAEVGRWRGGTARRPNTARASTPCLSDAQASVNNSTFATYTWLALVAGAPSGLALAWPLRRPPRCRRASLGCGG